jgi:hypothetical protein
MSKNITTAGAMTLEETASEYELKHFSSDITESVGCGTLGRTNTPLPIPLYS